jgi:hypothetical protein
LSPTTADAREIVMKIKVEFDLTPEEFRAGLGLPDIAALQNEALSMLKSKMSKNIDDIDVVNIVETLLGQGIAASRKFQEIVASATSGILDRDEPEKEKSEADEQ